MVDYATKLRQAADFCDRRESAVGDVAMCFEWYKQARDSADKQHRGRSLADLRAQLDEATERMLAIRA